MATIRTNVPGSGYGNVYVDSLVWGGTAWNQASGAIKVWLGEGVDEFDAAWEVHGDSIVLGDGANTYGWTPAEAQAVGYVLDLYSSVCGLTFEAANSIEDANIVWWQTQIGEGLLGYHETPEQNQIWGYFDPTTASWANMHFGGDGLNTIIHEIGHGLGLAHPHDGGANDGTTFPGVPYGDSSVIGDWGLNQGVWTVMSYNSGWDGVPYDQSFGGQGGLGAFDIAALQALYGVNYSTATGNDTYVLPTWGFMSGEQGWSCIWDAGGTDTLAAAAGANAVVIDLRPATLQSGDPNAGGSISSEDKIAGGYTIAYGVTIENATGGYGDDQLIGNGAANTLRGSGGSDMLWGDGGKDVLTGGTGYDIFVFDTRPSRSMNKDRITDFKVVDDSIWLDNAVFTKIGRGSYERPVKFKADMFVKASKAKDKEDRIIYDSKKGVLYYDADGSKSKYKMVEIATLKKGLAMTHNDFFVV